MIILGIDPGSLITGYGLIEQVAGKLRHIENGGIHCKASLTFNERLLYIHNTVAKLIDQYQPKMAAIEDVFYGKNIQSMLKLGQARGAAVIALLKAGIDVQTYTPTEVKMAVTGYGRADKEQVQKMTRMLLGLQEAAMKDASDALALAICHAQSHRFLKKTGKQ